MTLFLHAQTQAWLKARDAYAATKKSHRSRAKKLLALQRQTTKLLRLEIEEAQQKKRRGAA